MYCTACGKQIIDTARFCNYCGTPVAGAVFAEPTAPAASSTPTAPVAPSAPVSSGTPIETSPVSEPIQSNIPFESKESNAVNEAAPSSEPSQILNEEPQFAENESSSESTQAAAYGEVSEPVSNTAYDSVSDVGQSVSNVQAPVLDTVSKIETGNAYPLPAPGQIPMNGEGDIHAAQVSEKPAKPLPERKYTLGHIMMCLAAVAIMAIVAGVFAGLYFSVV